VAEPEIPDVQSCTHSGEPDKGVEAQVAAPDRRQGPLGTLKQRLHERVHVKVADGKVSFAAADASREATR